MIPVRELVSSSWGGPHRAVAFGPVAWVVVAVTLGSVIGFACALDRPLVAIDVLGVLGVGLMMRKRFYLLGLLLPIYAVRGVSPTTFLIARLAVLLLIVIADVAERRRSLLRFPDWRWVLLGFALLGITVLHPSPAGLYLTFALFIGATLGVRFAESPGVLKSILAGYCLGVFLSAVVLLGQALGLFDLSPGGQLVGYWGLSYRSTAFSYEAALALVIWWSRRKRRSSALNSAVWMAEGAVIAAAMLASGGRGGLIALGAAFFLLPAAAGRLGFAVRRIALAVSFVLVLGTLGFSSLSIERLVPTPRDPDQAIEDQYGSGRLDSYRSTLKAVRGHVVVGSGFMRVSPLQGRGSGGDMATYGIEGQRTGHNVLLTLLLAGGLVAAIPAILVLWEASRKAWLLTRRLPSEGWLAGAMTVLLARGLFETDGGLLGGQSVLLFSSFYASAVLVLATPAGRGSKRHTPAKM